MCRGLMSPWHKPWASLQRLAVFLGSVSRDLRLAEATSQTFLLQSHIFRWFLRLIVLKVVFFHITAAMLTVLTTCSSCAIFMSSYQMLLHHLFMKANHKHLKLQLKLDYLMEKIHENILRTNITLVLTIFRWGCAALWLSGGHISFFKQLHITPNSF